MPHLDYASSGAYFVTICVKDMKPVLGRVVGEKMELSQLGKIVEQVWQDFPKHYGNIELDECIVMPNHFHGIVWILGKTPQLESVGEGLRPSPTKTKQPYGLPEIVRAFKSFSSRRINRLQNTTGQPFWQRGFYDHVIRDESDLHHHRQYVRNNPPKWALDEYRQ